jgi:hypothetical protein
MKNKTNDARIENINLIKKKMRVLESLELNSENKPIKQLKREKYGRQNQIKKSRVTRILEKKEKPLVKAKEDIEMNKIIEAVRKFGKELNKNKI